MTFSDILKKLYYWDCELCSKPVIMTDKEQKGESCLCMDCINRELKTESELYQLTKSL